jgi:alpha-glucosidase
VYQVPESVFPRLPETHGVASEHAELEFSFEDNPFSFTIRHRSNREVLFDSSAAQMVFESQYVRLRTSLPENPSLYGMGEHTDPL